jgi:hypothetical protein
VKAGPGVRHDPVQENEEKHCFSVIWMKAFSSSPSAGQA